MSEAERDASARRFKRRATAVFVWVFLAFWLAGMTAGIAASACRSDRKTGQKKLRFCNVTITVGSILPGERTRRAMLYLERGIARAQLGDTEQARVDMVRAVTDALGGRVKVLRDDPMPRSAWFGFLVQRMGKEPTGSPARTIWDDVLANLTAPRT